MLAGPADVGASPESPACDSATRLLFQQIWFSPVEGYSFHPIPRRSMPR